MKRKLILYISIIGLAFILLACGNDVADDQEEKDTSKGEGKTEITQVLDWFTQPVHGGFLASQAQDYYNDAGLDVVVEAGGPQVNAVQIVASGKAEFGLDSADRLLLARDEGIPVVAVAAVLQKGPASMFFHKDAGIEDFADLNGRSVFATLATANWLYLKENYQLDEVKEVQFNGQYTNFIDDKESVTQGYATNTPFDLDELGIDTDHLLIADSGYRPYYSVIFTTEDYLKDNPEIVKAYVAATLEGYDYYIDNVEEVSELLKAENPDKSIESLVSEGELQKEYISGEDAEAHGIGHMTVDRWQELYDQLQDLDLLKKDLKVEDAFTTEYLSETES